MHQPFGESKSAVSIVLMISSTADVWQMIQMPCNSLHEVSSMEYTGAVQKGFNMLLPAKRGATLTMNYSKSR